jgi:hypothetical protein
VAKISSKKPLSEGKQNELDNPSDSQTQENAPVLPAEGAISAKVSGPSSTVQDTSTERTNTSDISSSTSIQVSATDRASSAGESSSTGGAAEAANEVQEDFLQLPELRPPNIMPRGNVGTSTKERDQCSHNTGMTGFWEETHRYGVT